MSDLLNDRDLKARFAREWCRRPSEPFKVAFGLIPDVTDASRCASSWMHDPDVLAEVSRIRQVEPQASTLPTKEEVARKLFDMAEDATKSYAERLQAYRQYNDVMGYITKPGTTTNVTVPVVNRVLKVKEYANLDQWEAKSLENQRQLAADARPVTAH